MCWWDFCVCICVACKHSATSFNISTGFQFSLARLPESIASLGVPDLLRDSEAKLLLWLGCIEKLLKFVVSGYWKWCFTLNSVKIQWNYGSALLLYSIHTILTNTVALLKHIPFSKHVPKKYLCSHVVLQDVFIEQFIVNFPKQPACKYTIFCKKIENLAYTWIEKLTLLNYGRKSRHFDVHLPST